MSEWRGNVTTQKMSYVNHETYTVLLLWWQYKDHIFSIKTNWVLPLREVLLFQNNLPALLISEFSLLNAPVVTMRLLLADLSYREVVCWRHTSYSQPTTGRAGILGQTRSWETRDSTDSWLWLGDSLTALKNPPWTAWWSRMFPPNFPSLVHSGMDSHCNWWLSQPFWTLFPPTNPCIFNLMLEPDSQRTRANTGSENSSGASGGAEAA